MDSVWLVYSEYPYEGQSIRGVFGTEEEARAWAESVGLTDEYDHIAEWQIGETEYYYTPESWAVEQERRKNRKPDAFLPIPGWISRFTPTDTPLMSLMNKDKATTV